MAARVKPLEPLESLEEQLLQQLLAIISHYLKPQQVSDVVRAYHKGADAHVNQFRKSGEPYICHPLNVAIILAKMRMDTRSIIAAILHDVIEDTPISKDDLSKEFSHEVANLVDGVTKLNKVSHKSHIETQAKNVNKMLLAMANDLRVIIVKLADRLHNMQTLGAMSAETKRRIAKETLEIYVPIANRLSMNKIRQQLEVLCMQAMYPTRHRVIAHAVTKTRGNRKEAISNIKTAIQNTLTQAEIRFDVVGREKNTPSIYYKMKQQKISFSDVFDVYAFRVYCENVSDCYRILGYVHALYKPVPGKFKDYIGLPKENGYQSLHTVLIGSFGFPIEIQIRTHEMHRVAESGIAAHWLYKSNDTSGQCVQDRANEWLTKLLEIQKTAGDSLEFLENLKVDLIHQEVFVFTPQGSIIKLPRGASIIDFAYAIHTDIGNACASAKIDNTLVPLQTKLENGATVEIITTQWAKPNPLWLNFANTAKARSSIRNYLKHFKQKDAVRLGQRLLEKELNVLRIKFEDIADSRILELLNMMKLQTMDALFEEIGLGNKMPILVARQLSQDDIHTAIKLEEAENTCSPLIIKGAESMVITLSKCCKPIPGDPIVGFFSPGRGIVVHHYECHSSHGSKKQEINRLDVEWSKEVSGEFLSELKIEALNQRGTLATITSTISNMDSSIENVSVTNQDSKVSTDTLTLTVKDRVHLAGIIRRLKKLSIILKITRITTSNDKNNDRNNESPSLHRHLFASH